MLETGKEFPLKSYESKKESQILARRQSGELLTLQDLRSWNIPPSAK